MYVCVRTRACVCVCTCACVCMHTGTHALCGWVDCSAWEKSIGLGVRSQPLARPGSSPGRPLTSRVTMGRPFSFSQRHVCKLSKNGVD